MQGVKAGESLALVFKAQPFVIVPNQAKQTMEALLNVISGTYRGLPDATDPDGTFLFETESNNGIGMLWRVREEDLLLYGTRRSTANLASV